MAEISESVSVSGSESSQGLLIRPTALCQIEIHVRSLDLSQKFYAGVFGWKASAAELHHYVVLDVPKDCSFGISLVPSLTSSISRGEMILYFSVTDGSEVASRAEMFGGSKKFGPVALAAYGNIWQISDPDGHRFGLFESRK
jgi:predicted enzyme related to lactoylglutathione lyase